LNIIESGVKNHYTLIFYHWMDVWTTLPVSWCRKTNVPDIVIESCSPHKTPMLIFQRLTRTSYILYIIRWI